MGAPMASLRDDFEDASISSSAWTQLLSGSATVSEASGRLTMALPSSTAGTHYAGVQSRYLHDLTSDSISVNTVTMVSTSVAASAVLELRVEPNKTLNRLCWQQSNGTLIAQHIVAGVATTAYSVTWNATTHAYLRIRADTTNVYWDDSTNGTTWNNRASRAISLLFPITDLSVLVYALCGNVASPGSWVVQYVNLLNPSLTTNWRYQWARWPLTNRHKRVTIAIDAAKTAQGYLVTADGVDASGNPSGNVRYWSGPAGGGRLLTQQASQAAAQAMAVDLPLNGSFDLPTQIDARYFQLYDRSVDGSAYVVREFFPRRLVQADDIEAESIVTIHLAAGAITADKLDANLIVGNTISTAYNGARVTLSGAADGGLIGYGPTDTYNPVSGTGTYQILWSLQDGQFYAGDGEVILNDLGIIVGGGHPAQFRKAVGTATPRGSIWFADDAFADSLMIERYAGGSTNTRMTLVSDQIVFGFSAGTELVLLNTGDLTLGVGTMTITNGGLNVGGALGAAAGQVRASSVLSVQGASTVIQAVQADTNTATAPTMLQLRHNLSSGTAAAGMGSQFVWYAQSTTTGDQLQQSMNTAWVDATHGSRKARALTYVYDTAAREAIRLETNGSQAMLCFLGGAAAIRQSIGAAAPAGGTGTAAGGWDTAAHRDSSITLLNNIRTALINLGLCQT